MTFHSLSRREFLQCSAAGLLALLVPMKPLAAQNAISGRKLVVLFLAGGCDTVNAFPPNLEQNYYDIRPTIAIPDDEVLTLNGCELGMHPALSELQGIWDAGHMALFPAAHCGPNPNRSHFYQYDFYDRGDYTTNSTTDSTGWLARFLNSRYTQSNGIEAFDFYGRTKVFNASAIPVLAVSNPDNVRTGPNTALANAVVGHLRELADSKQRSGPSHDYTQTQEVLFDRINTLDGIDFSVDPQNGATYPSSTLGRQLHQTAVLLRNLPELEVIQIAKGGWDTHNEQGAGTGRQADLFTDVGDSLRAFYDDLGAERDNVTVILRTEFGRTAHENGSFGTDHGHASAWVALGGAVQGGQYGAWPGFDIADLASERYTAQTIDYRDILAEALNWMGMSDPAAVFPEYTYNAFNYLSG